MKRKTLIQAILVTVLLVAWPLALALAQTKDYGTAPEIARAAQSLGNKYALVIGVDYPPPYTLDWTVKDARMVAETLEKIYGFNVTLLTEKSETTREAIVRSLGRFKKKVRSGKDQVIFFFSGHGVHDPDSKEVGYLVPVDGRRDDLFSTCINMNILQSLSKAFRARHSLFIIDSCYSGIIGGFSNMSFDTGAANSALIQSYLGMKARQVLTAGRSEETARMSAARQMSLYSFYLHRALNAEGGAIRADMNRDRVVTVRELQEYLAGKVVSETGGKQNPRIFNYTENDGQFVFVPQKIKHGNDETRRQAELAAQLQRERAAREKAEARAKELVARQKTADLERQIAEERRLREEAERRARELEAQRQRAKAEEKAEADRRQTLLAMGSRPKRSSPGKSKTFTNSLGMKFVYIEPGSFDMGQSEEEKQELIRSYGKETYDKYHDDEKQYQVTLTRGYYLQTIEVTVGQWRAFVLATGHKSEAETDGWAWGYDFSKGKWEKRDGLFWDSPGFDQSDSHPVTCISWNDAQAFIKWVNRSEKGTYRLPTEAEWEYAARAGTKASRFWGDSPGQACRYANVADRSGNKEFSKKYNLKWSGIHECEDGYFTTAPVGSFQPNPWGLYDMIGNVWEWCQDRYGKYPSGSVTDPTGPSSGSYRVFRGGSWNNSPRDCRSANRYRIEPGYRGYYLGFRLVLDSVR